MLSSSLQKNTKGAYKMELLALLTFIATATYTVKEVCQNGWKAFLFEEIEEKEN